jgi:hypothetical protein
MPRQKSVPSYRRHSSGNARVTINGRDYMLGPYGSPESCTPNSKQRVSDPHIRGHLTYGDMVPPCMLSFLLGNGTSTIDCKQS